MRVLHVLPSDPARVIGGLEAHAMDLMAGLREQGLEVAAVAPGAGPSADGLIWHVRAGFLRLASLYRAGSALHPPWPDGAYAAAIEDIVQGWRPQVVHSHGNAFYSVGRALEKAPVPWVHTLHDYGLLCPKATLWRTPSGKACEIGASPSCLPCYIAEGGVTVRHILRGTALITGALWGRRRLRLPDRLIAISRYVALAHERRLPALRSRIQVIPNWPIGDDAQAEAPLPAPPGPFALYVGSVSPHKGLPFLLRVWSGLPAAPVLVACVSGPRAALDHVARQGGEQVRLLANVPHRHVLSLWKRASLGLVPSLWPEPFSLVALEAMAAGCPLVVSAAGALPEVVGEAGLAVPPGDVDGWRSQIVRLMGDPALRASLGEAGRRRTLRLFSRAASIAAVRRLYEELCRGGHGR